MHNKLKSLKKYTLISAAVILVLGTLSHFVYEFFGKNQIVGFFFPVNESTWEHLKLILTPVFLAGLVQWAVYGKEYKNFFPSLLVSVLTGMFVITSAFYTYTGIIGVNFPAADIFTFVLGTAAACYVQYRLLKSGKLSSDLWRFVSAAGFVLLFVFSALASLDPPGINLFKDPLTAALVYTKNSAERPSTLFLSHYHLFSF